MSSKLTFSLVFVLMLALVAVPTFAQTMYLSPNLNTGADLETGVTATSQLSKTGFVVYVMNSTNSPPLDNGIPDAANDPVITVTASSNNNVDFPKLADLFAFGGTIELVSNNSDAKLYITEIMWGINESEPVTDQAEPQWIEVYNQGADLAVTDEVRLLFTTNQRVERADVKLAAVGGTVTITTGVVTAPAADAADAAMVTYTVLDRVSVVNRFGARWDPPGQSGRTIASTDGKHPVKNLVSMYRKRSTNDAKDGYKYDKDGKPDGDKFGDGTDGGQWEKSVGRINMSGNFIGTPGAVQQDDGGQVVSAKAPASLPATSVIINEIYNSFDLQWIELHNTGDTEVNIKNWEMEAAYPFTANLQRVFAIPDKDTKIPAGGFLVITNKDPADSILAGGVDLYDTNNDKFPAGASHLYIVIEPGSETAGDNEQPNGSKANQWMLLEGFMLVLRNGNEKNNHEKIVDIAGNLFVKVANDTIVTDVWPLKGWTVPDNLGTAAEQEARWSPYTLSADPSRTYARKEQRSRANRLHKEDWEPNVGFRGGLGYDPNVDRAMAPGTPGYANNAQKDKPADITGEIVISEIMYDAGPNGNLAQWIELYNSSMTEAANLKDWEFEIRNIDTDVESYVDAKFKFDGDAVILPNQTLLLVSDRSSASDVVANRVYNLYQKHRNDLGLSARKSVLLSSEGFHLALRDKDGNTVDDAGNVMLDGPRRTVMWELHETGGDMRFSIIRSFGTRATYDGNRGIAHDGTLASSWYTAQSVGSYYGHRDDVGSPGHREGSPLPVSLSSFRPVRDKATGEVVIRWVTESELNNAGFNILRSETKESEFKVINVKGIIAGHGTTSEKHVYTYTDTTAKPNIVYYYQIEDVSLDGKRTTLATTHLRGKVTATGKVTTTWADLKAAD